MRPILTNKEQKVFSILKQYFAEYDQSPTLEQVKTRLRVNSINTITKYLKKLEEKGYISRQKHARRNIELVDMDKNGVSVSTVTLPVFGSVGCDDLSIFIQEQHDEFLEVDTELVKGKSNPIVVRAMGESMNDAGINNGDYILVEQTEQANNNDRVVAIVDDMITVKKLQRTKEATVLWPESRDSKYKPIFLRSNFKIVGKIICTIPGNRADISEVVSIEENY
jgi:repressor LexA